MTASARRKLVREAKQVAGEVEDRGLSDLLFSLVVEVETLDEEYARLRAECRRNPGSSLVQTLARKP